MRKDNLIFFVSGLVFGVAVGYFLFQSVAQSSRGRAASLSAPPAVESSSARPPLDTREVSRLEEIARANPADAEVRQRIGNLYMESGRLQEAIQWFRESLAIAPDELHVRNHLALSLAGMGRMDEAISEYESALAFDPAHPQSLLGLGRVLLLGKNDIRGGIEVWEKLVESAPDSPEARSIREELEALKSAHPMG